MRLLKINQVLIFSLLLTKILIVTNWFIEGDQKSYFDAYNGLSKNLATSFLFYQSKINATINIHFLFAFLFKFIGISKYWFSVVSSISLALVWFKLLRKNTAMSSLYVFLILNTYYFDVLYFSAERLKFAVLFIGLFLLQSKVLNLFLSVGSHLQTIIFLPLYKNHINKYIQLIAIALIILIILTLDFTVYIKDKITGYFVDFGGYFPIKTIILLTPLYFNKFIRFSSKVYLLIYFMILSLILGDLRINIILFLFLLTIKHTPKSKQIMVFLNLYFLIKTIPFIYKGYLYGTGF